jgi:hypothetical protein
MLFLENGKTNICRLEFDMKYELSTDTNKVQIYTPTLVQTHNAIFNPSTCGLQRFDYVTRFL